MSKPAVVLLSGGLDSATVLAIAIAEGFECYCLSFLYGQKHSNELDYANGLVKEMGVREHKTAIIDLGAFGQSALTDESIDVPDADPDSEEIPVTYVPARNTVFLSYALCWAEVLDSNDIFIGVNAVDYSGYPDCRPEFIRAFENTANLATRMGIEGSKLRVHTPLIDLTKGEIIERGLNLGVNYANTVSCYRLNKLGEACGICDSCILRTEGFRQAGVIDPTVYVKNIV